MLLTSQSVELSGHISLYMSDAEVVILNLCSLNHCIEALTINVNRCEVSEVYFSSHVGLNEYKSLSIS